MAAPLAGLIVALAGLVGLAALLWRMRAEPQRIAVVRYDVTSPELPEHLDGFTLCQIADSHITAAPRNRDAIAEAIRSVRADLYVLTGDMIFLQSGMAAFVHWFGDLGEAAKPAVAVLGNAEHKPFLNTSEVVQAFCECGLTVLRNECLRVPVGKGFLQVVGVDDPHSHHADFAKAYAEADPKAWTLLLCHSPDGVVDLSHHRADLMLCGHTHGGQMRIPGLPALAQNTKRVRGLVAGWYDARQLARWTGDPNGRTQLYVSRGLGMSQYAGRLFCAPELPVFTLRSARP